MKVGVSSADFNSQLICAIQREGFNFYPLKSLPSCSYLSDVPVLVVSLPCNHRTLIEFGWTKGRGVPTIVYLNGATLCHDSLLHSADLVTDSIDEVLAFLKRLKATLRGTTEGGA